MRKLCIVLALAACGDDPVDPPIEEGLCDRQIGALPDSGPFVDAYAIAPAGCLTGGLEDLPGRWFVTDPTQIFSFFYPRYGGSCEAGFRREGEPPEDRDISDGVAFHSYSDGTVIYTRQYFRFETEEGPFEFSSAFVACMTENGFEATQSRLGFEGEITRSDMVGQPFDRKEPAEASGLSLVGEVAIREDGTPIMAFNVVVDGGFAYVVGPFGLDVIDVTSSAAPRPVGYFPGAFNDVRVVRGNGTIVAYAAPYDGDETLAINVTDPEKPVIAMVIPEYSHSLQVVQTGPTTHLYLANYTDQVPKFDVSVPTAPVRLGQSAIPGDPTGIHDLTVDGDRIYANYTDRGFVAFDVNAVGTSVERGRMASSYSHASAIGNLTSGRRVILHGDEGMTGTPDGGAFMRVLEGDTASPNYMTEIGRYQSRTQVGIHNIELRGDKAYVAYYQDGVRIVDLSTPEAPQEIAHYNTWDPLSAPGGSFEGTLGIRVAGELIYVADSLRGLLILTE
jgi:hypothetical protein